MNKHTVFSVILFISLFISTIGIAPTSVEASEDITFSDTKKHWAKDSIDALVSTGAIHGYPDGTFKPNGTITKAQFSKVLATLLQVESNDLAFPIIKGHWAASYINGLKDSGVISSSDYLNGYDANGEITRLEMSKMIGRSLTLHNNDWKAVLEGLAKLDYIKVPFLDRHIIPTKDMPFVALANGSGIVSGYADGNYGPGGLATRAQAVVMLHRYLNTKGRNVDVSKLVNQYKGEKSIHDYSISELENWVNKDTEVKRLKNIGAKSEYFNTFEENNEFFLKRSGKAYWTEKFLDVGVNYMNTYFNRDYKTINNQFIENIRYFHKHGVDYNGIHYSNKELPAYFSKLVADTKSQKIISESIFISDITLLHKIFKNGSHVGDRVRGSQYIRYTSGASLPKDVSLNKWYKRDVDLQLQSFSWNMNVITWDAADYSYEELIPISNYQVLK